METKKNKKVGSMSLKELYIVKSRLDQKTTFQKDNKAKKPENKRTRSWQSNQAGSVYYHHVLDRINYLQGKTA
jgi:hypothetical protein